MREMAAATDSRLPSGHGRKLHLRLKEVFGMCVIGKKKHKEKIETAKIFRDTILKRIWFKNMNKPMIEDFIKMIQTRALSDDNEYVVRLFEMKCYDKYVDLYLERFSWDLEKFMRIMNSEVTRDEIALLLSDIIEAMCLLHGKNITPLNITVKNIFVVQRDGKFRIKISPYEVFDLTMVNKDVAGNKAMDMYDLGPIIEFVDAVGDKAPHHEAQHLLQLLRKDIINRPTANEVRKHPTFYSQQKGVRFISTASDVILTYGKKDILGNTCNLRRDITNLYLTILQGRESWEPWFRVEINQHVLFSVMNKPTTGQHTSYKTNNIVNLIRCIRNNKHHHMDIALDMSVDPTVIYPVQLIQIIENECPNLVIEVYIILDSYKQFHHLPALKEFF